MSILSGDDSHDDSVVIKEFTSYADLLIDTKLLEEIEELKEGIRQASEIINWRKKLCENYQKENARLESENDKLQDIINIYERSHAKNAKDM